MAVGKLLAMLARGSPTRDMRPSVKDGVDNAV